MSAATAKVTKVTKVEEAVAQAQSQSQSQPEAQASVSPNKKPIKPMPADVAKLETKSAKIRALHAQNWTTGDIARTMDIRYQHARNVIMQPLKRKDA